MPFKFIEGVTLADVAFEATGGTLEELFESAAEAVTATMIKKVASVKPVTEKRIRLKARDAERLLHDFLEELVFLKDAEGLLFSRYSVRVGAESAEATLKGERIDPKRHDMLVDVKAVTWHGYVLVKTPKGWKARVVLDV